mmetsp:Transcript_43333/g.90737  ORF Transcript_43333/g.90737 Transcript_43333/m.90737 type:complete len:366 (-) Transcript_43333:3160-4257(-)
MHNPVQPPAEATARGRLGPRAGRCAQWVSSATACCGGPAPQQPASTALLEPARPTASHASPATSVLGGLLGWWTVQRRQGPTVPQALPAPSSARLAPTAPAAAQTPRPARRTLGLTARLARAMCKASSAPRGSFARAEASRRNHAEHQLATTVRRAAPIPTEMLLVLRTSFALAGPRTPWLVRQRLVTTAPRAVQAREDNLALLDSSAVEGPLAKLLATLQLAATVPRGWLRLMALPVRWDSIAVVVRMTKALATLCRANTVLWAANSNQDHNVLPATIVLAAVLTSKLVRHRLVTSVHKAHPVRLVLRATRASTAAAAGRPQQRVHHLHAQRRVCGVYVSSRSHQAPELPHSTSRKAPSSERIA